MTTCARSGIRALSRHDLDRLHAVARRVLRNNQDAQDCVQDALVKALAARPGHVKSRDMLMDAAYGEHIYVDDRTIDSHVKRIRKKFKVADTDFSQIETLYGVGYRYKES